MPDRGRNNLGAGPTGRATPLGDLAMLVAATPSSYGQIRELADILAPAIKTAIRAEMPIVGRFLTWPVIFNIIMIVLKVLALVIVASPAVALPLFNPDTSGIEPSLRKAVSDPSP